MAGKPRWVPLRPNTVSVITNEGQRCTLPHQPGSEVRAYLKACEPGRINRIDRAWLIQPDGSVRDLGIASWNAQAQDQVAPGAILWAPARDSGWSPKFSALLVQFLATQGYDTLLSVGEFPRVAPTTAVTPCSLARDAVALLADAASHGLEAGDYDMPALAQAQLGVERAGVEVAGQVQGRTLAAQLAEVGRMRGIALDAEDLLVIVFDQHATTHAAIAAGGGGDLMGMGHGRHLSAVIG